MNKTINQTIQEYTPLINREPIKLSNLRSFINDKRDKIVSSSAARNIFIGNNDFYNNNYINIARDHYVPKNLFNQKDSIIKYISNDNDYMFDDLSLGYDLKINAQDIHLPSYIIFGKKPDNDWSDFFKKWVNVRYLDVKKDNLKNDFKLLYSLDAFDDYSSLNNYLSMNKKNYDDVMDAYTSINNNTNLINDELPNIGDKLWKANAWLKLNSK